MKLYVAPTPDEIRLLIKTYWQSQLNPSRRARADDRAFLSLKVRLTQEMMQRLVRSGVHPVKAEGRAMLRGGPRGLAAATDRHMSAGQVYGARFTVGMT